MFAVLLKPGGQGPLEIRLLNGLVRWRSASIMEQDQHSGCGGDDEPLAWLWGEREAARRGEGEYVPVSVWLERHLIVAGQIRAHAVMRSDFEPRGPISFPPTMNNSEFACVDSTDLGTRSLSPQMKKCENTRGAA